MMQSLSKENKIPRFSIQVTEQWRPGTGNQVDEAEIRNSELKTSIIDGRDQDQI